MSATRTAVAVLQRVRRLQARLARRLLLWNKALLQRCRGTSTGRTQVFVVGMQRSGTNMLVDCLERSYQTDVYHETDPRAFDQYLMREPAVIRQLVQRSPAECFVIKALCELDRLPMLATAFAPAKIVWIVRDYNDVVNSARVSFKSLPGDMTRLAADRDGADWRGRGMSDATHVLLRRLYTPGSSADTAIALFWYLRNILFFEQGWDRDPRVLLVRYERLVTQPEQEFRRLFTFLGLRYAPRISRHVFAHSIGRRETPAIAPEVRAVCEDLLARFAAVQDG